MIRVIFSSNPHLPNGPDNVQLSSRRNTEGTISTCDTLKPGVQLINRSVF